MAILFPSLAGKVLTIKVLIPGTKINKKKAVSSIIGRHAGKEIQFVGGSK